MKPESQPALWTFVLCLHITNACLPVRLAGDGRSTPSRDTTQPTITCISNIHKTADPTAQNVSVWWDENTVVVADDSNDEIIKTRTGLSPGEVFSEGTTTITYHARDSSGNFAYCSFNVTVEVIRCSHWDNLVDGWRLCNVGYEMRLGTVCEFGCYTGHVLVGPDLRECTMSGEWDTSTQPFCQKKECPVLNPTESQGNVVNISCTNENYFGSICSYSCVEGYGLLPGHNTVQLCTDNGEWLGDTPVCYDTSSPQYSNCPAAVAGYAEPSMISGQVLWQTPAATDNSGMVVPVVQTSGPQSGSVLTVGQYDVEYSATDVLNNTAVCQFTVFVKQISCPELEELSYTTVVCPDSRVLGSRCNFSCEDGTELRGQDSAVCIQEDSAIPRADWDFQQQPYCEPIDGCPTLQQPTNGRLLCDTWEYGTVCHVTCDDGYLVSDDTGTDYDDIAIHNTVLVCGDTGYWTNNGSSPVCQEEDARTTLYLRIGLIYDNIDDCAQLANETLHSILTQAVKDALHPVCQPPKCNITGIQAICDVGATFELSIQLYSNMTSEDIAFLRSDMINITESSDIYESLKIDISGEQKRPEDFEVSQPVVQCESGSGYDTKTSECVKCNAGYYFDNVTSSCTSCPLGYYQNMPRQSECIQCPLGTTTSSLAASSSTQCTEACAAGSYSETGTPTCSACDVGSYSDTYSNTGCTVCPSSQATLFPGTSSVDQCEDFDIVFTSPDLASTSATVGVELQDVSTFTLSLWFQCSVCNNILTLTESERLLMSVTNGNTLTLQLSSGLYDSTEDIPADAVWRKLTILHTKHEMYVYVGDHMVLHRPMNSSITENLSSPASLTIGGDGFQGSVSQVHMWSNLQPLGSNVTCLPDVDGDLVHWGKFVQPEGLYVITYTRCEASLNCSSSPCQNNGSCIDIDGGFTCACLPGYSGTQCEMNTSYCEGNACSNNGTCIEAIDGYRCACADNFTGDLCQLSVVHGGWTDWDVSGACSVSCGTGVQQRSRVCENPVASNGGEECQGSSQDTLQCDTNSVCVNECDVNPTSVDYGDMNCERTDNATRACTPTCHEGYDFDNNIYLDKTAPVCSELTGYIWNIRNGKNPYAQIPSCTEKTIALKSTVDYSAVYDTLSYLDSTIERDIRSVVGNTLQTGCIQTGRCILERTSVFLATQANSDSYVTFTSTVSCEPTQSVNDCYDLLVNLLTSVEQAIEQQELTVLYDEVQYDVGVNTSSVDGTSLCIEGYVPVMQYCVPCGTGTYAVSNYCELCAQGYYQDELGLTSCKQCPNGFTTEGQMTREKELCNVPVPASDDVINWQIFTVAILCAVIGVLLIIATVYILWDRKFKKPNKTKDAYADTISEPETPPIVRFNVRNKRYMGQAVRKDPTMSPDGEEFPDVQNNSDDLVFDVVEDITWNDYSSVNLPETPISYGIKSPTFRFYSSPISQKHHAWN